MTETCLPFTGMDNTAKLPVADLRSPGGMYMYMILKCYYVEIIFGNKILSTLKNSLTFLFFKALWNTE
jgi:hypothetical protein